MKLAQNSSEAHRVPVMMDAMASTLSSRSITENTKAPSTTKGRATLNRSEKSIPSPIARLIESSRIPSPALSANTISADWAASSLV